MIETMPTLVVFGLDPEGKPRAAQFAEPDAELAVKAAALLGYRAVRISDAEILEGLPDGDVFARGNGFYRARQSVRVRQAHRARGQGPGRRPRRGA